MTSTFNSNYRRRHNHNYLFLSQELFDETIVNNEDVFDLTPDEALRETIVQYTSTRNPNVRLEHLVLSHPNNNNNSNIHNNTNERQRRQQFVELLVELKNQQQEQRSNNGGIQGQGQKDEKSDARTTLTRLKCTLEMIRNDYLQCCRQQQQQENQNLFSYLVLMDQHDVMSTLQSLFCSTTKYTVPTTKEQGQGQGQDDSTTMTMTNVDIIIIIQTMIVRIMILMLSYRPRPSRRSPSRPTSPVTDTTTIDCTTTSTTTTSTTSTTASSSDVVVAKLMTTVQSNFRDDITQQFIMSWMTWFQFVVRTSNDNNNGNNNSTTTATRNNDMQQQQQQQQLQSSLLQLAYVMCRSNEGNKRMWVQQGSNGSSANDDMHVTTTATTTTTSRVPATSTTPNKNGIDMVLQILTKKTTTTNQRQQQRQSSPITIDTIVVGMQSHVCQLITTLCRFDDWRRPSNATPTTPTGTASTPAALPPVTSSAHDHVLEWSKHGTVPVLYELATSTIVVLDVARQQQEQQQEYCSVTTDTTNDSKTVDSECESTNIDNKDNDKKKSSTVDEKSSTVNKGTKMTDKTDDDEDDDDDDETGKGATTGSTTTTPSSKEQQQQLQLLLSHVLSALRALAIQNDVVQSMVAVGVLDLVQTTLSQTTSTTSSTDNIHNNDFKYDVPVLASTCGLIRNLCANDEIKTTLCCSSRLVQDMLHAMDVYSMHAPLQEHGCATIAAMALRAPNNSKRLVQHHAAHVVIIRAMKKHATHTSIQRQGALALRNLASRSTADDDIDIRQTLLDAGAQDVLVQLAGRHQQSVDEAYAALRELKCDDVQVLKVDRDGNMVQRSTMFGQGTLNFRPVLEESSNDVKHG